MAQLSTLEVQYAVKARPTRLDAPPRASGVRAGRPALHPERQPIRTLQSGKIRRAFSGRTQLTGNRQKVHRPSLTTNILRHSSDTRQYLVMYNIRSDQ